MGLGVLLPILLFAIPSIRRSRQGQFLCGLMTVLGFIVNRLNVSLTGMLGASGAKYFPSWMELAVTAAMVAVGFAGFSLAVKYLAVFRHGEEPSSIHAPNLRQATVNGRGLLVLWGLVGVGVVLMLVAGRPRAEPAGLAGCEASREGMGTLPGSPCRSTAATAALQPARAEQPKVKLVSPELKLPDTFTFPKGEGSPGEVSFSHDSHHSRMEGTKRACATCHEAGFSLGKPGKALVGSVTMERMQKGELCGSCHNGAKAFALDDCVGCHQ
jgi:c(7)-type cytochrome triheme protein